MIKILNFIVKVLASILVILMCYLNLIVCILFWDSKYMVGFEVLDIIWKLEDEKYN